MADPNAQLDDELRRLDEEFEEGDITRKGYEKRRTLLFNQFLSPQDAPAPRQRGLRIHSAEDSDHPASSDAGSRTQSLAALNGQSASASSNGTMNSGRPEMSRRTSALRDSYGNELYQNETPVSHAQRLQQREMGGSFRQSSSSGSFDNRRDTLMVESSDGSRTQTMLSQNYAFNPDTQQNYGGIGH